MSRARKQRNRKKVSTKGKKIGHGEEIPCHARCRVLEILKTQEAARVAKASLSMLSGLKEKTPSALIAGELGSMPIGITAGCSIQSAGMGAQATETESQEVQELMECGHIVV